MFVLNDEQRSGLLVAVITGGRPLLKDRPTARLLSALDSAGLADVVWVVSESHAAEYERDGRPLAVYPDEWATSYATDHWTGSEPYTPGGFYGAFVGREWACLEAERRGCWGVLQLDDNITRLHIGARGTTASSQHARDEGGLALFADLLGAAVLSTNARTAGAQLSSVAEPESRVLRPGFPYSLFVEQVGEGREHWYGPFEDDITHSFQYGTRGDGAVPVVLPQIRYTKKTGGKSGMRAHYSATRSLSLQRMFPQSAQIVLKTKHSNGSGQPRVFHHMRPDAIKNRLHPTDPTLLAKLRDRVTELMRENNELMIGNMHRKIEKRVRKGAS